MNLELNVNSDEKHNTISNCQSNRRIYSREDLFRYYYCTKEIPDYLKDFQYLHNNFTEDNWCKKPIPKFEVIETKGKPVYNANKVKGRQRTLSSQSGDNVDFNENYTKQRSYTSSNGKSSRYGNSPKEMRSTEDIKAIIAESNNKFINTDDFIENDDSTWHRVEPKAFRTYNSSKPYAQNFQVTENHWKKWTKDSNQSGDKNRSQNRSERANMVWTRRSENDTRQRSTKSFGRHSVSKSGDQTEDIWQDDWDTELKSEIAKDTDDLMLDSFEFPKSSVLPVTPPPNEMEQKSPVFEKQKDNINPGFDLWFYRDLSDIERGPFSSENMANWLATGYFNPSTFVRRACDERFLLLAEYRALYGRIPFTVGPTIHPIHATTPVTIDLKQLLIGVEMNLIQKVVSCATTLPPISEQPIIHNNVMRTEDNKQMNSNAAEMIAILEEKRILEESRAELERERERILQEKEQWRERMEAEYKAKMEEIILQQSLANSVNIDKHVSVRESREQIDIVNATSGKLIVEQIERKEMVDEHQQSNCATEIQSPDVKSSVSTDKKDTDIDQSLHLMDDTEKNHWFSKREAKRQRQKKTKNQENKSTKTEKEIVLIPEAKHPEQPTDSRISFISAEQIALTKKENKTHQPMKIELDSMKTDSFLVKNPSPNVNNSILPTPTKSLNRQSKIARDEDETKVKPTKLESTIRKNEVSSSWAQSPISPGFTTSTATKSLLEIQAEEAAKEKKENALQNAVMAQAAEMNKISSFKDSLLKSAKSPKQPVIPIGKSIWDVVPTECPVTKPFQTPESVSKKNVEFKNSKDNVKNPSPVNKKPNLEIPDQLSDWCVKKLSKFSDKFDIHTVIELLKTVPNEEVMELALQLLDDSKFTSGFVVEFINKRQELIDGQTEGSWHTVKKPIGSASTPVNATVSSSKGKNAKSKAKKKMIVVETKFR